MTIAEKLIAEGFKRGFEQGLEQGREQGLEESMEKGMEKSVAKGLEKWKLEVAENLLRLGVEIDMIIKATGLAEEKIRKLIN